MSRTPAPAARAPVPGRSRRRWLTGLVAVVVAALTGSLVLAPAGGGAAAASVSPPGVDQATGRTYPVTLVTGDVTALYVAPDGRQAAWVVRAAAGDDRSRRPAQIYEQEGQVHVVPAEALPYVAAGALDERLFNVTALVRQGYHDQARRDLPLMITGTRGRAARHARDLPAGARLVRELDSLGAASITVDKPRIRAVWEALRGPEPAVTAAGARLAGGAEVWLNGRVQAALGDSVPQVGAPAAWQAGFDGSGVPVAVLDTGYDPTHPDLADQVIGARNFTEEPDPSGQVAIDQHGHGTHVAATIAGTGGASDGARPGVAPGADLLVGKVLDSTGSGADDQIIAGMEWAVAQGARVVNVSLGTPYPSDGTDPLSQAVDRLTESSGALFVVAAGNNGPEEQTVAAPGAATHALTVGATTKDDEPAGFSSRGPRWGDLMVKPEIVAPGVEIVAARAAGTSLGNLLDARHTALSGTSMATPHVAGAAAILAQQHPEWTADQLKARLVSTSVELPDQPVTFQGAGRLDLARAVGTPLAVGTAALSLGRIPHDAAPVTRTVTYHNHSGRPQVLLLTADVTGTGARAGQRPALRVSPPVLVVPAGGRASAELRLTPERTDPGGYAGRLVARSVTRPWLTLHTVTAFTVDGPPRTVTVTGVDREGRPAQGLVMLWSADTGTLTSDFMFGGTLSMQVPEGLYTLAAALQTTEDGFTPTSFTVAVDPELTVRRDRTVHFDARDGGAVRVATPRETDVESYQLTWRRQVRDRSITMAAAEGWDDVALYALPNPRARTGSFDVATTWTMAQPTMVVTVPGDPGIRATPWYAGSSTPYIGQESVPVVDAGLGTPEELAGLDVAGKVVLVSRRGEWQLEAQAAAAAEAGAALLLGYNDRPGAWLEPAPSEIPVYLTDRSIGERIRSAVAADPGLAADLYGIQDPEYSYELVFPEDRLPAGRTYRVADHPMATVKSDYRDVSGQMGRREGWVAFVDSMSMGGGSSLTRLGPVHRTEYVSTERVEWQRYAQPHGELPGIYWTWSAVTDYRPGRTYHETWWGPLTRPGVPQGAGMPVTRFHDAIRINMPHYLYDNGRLSGTIYEQMGDSSELVLRRDGEVVGSTSWPEAQFTVPPEEAGYELALSVTAGPGNFSDLSVRTESVWRFRSQRPEQTRQVLPLVQLAYELPGAGLSNEVRADAAYPLRIVPGYQPGATGPGGFTVTVAVSYDDGGSWQPAPVAPAGGALAAAVPAAPAGADFATVRVVATDRAGNQLDQLVERAWRVAPAS